MNIRRVVCAATLLPSGFTLVGARHCDSRMLEQCKAVNQKYSPISEGFIDQWGKFMDRSEAWIVANNANQVIKIVGGNDQKVLYSENLY